MRKNGIGIRGLFRIAILIVVAMAYLAIMCTSYLRISNDEQEKAEASVRSEATYLCLQLQSLEERAEAFHQVLEATGTDPHELESTNPAEYQLLNSPTGDVLVGYTLAETGTVAIISDNVVVESDDARVPSGSDSGKLVFLVADVSGKGIPASLFMMKAAAKVRSEHQKGSSLTQAVENVSKELAENNATCMFVTMWVGVLDYGTGHLEYVNAGHNPPLLWHEGGWQWLREKSGIPLGLRAGRRPVRRHHHPGP